ncbi:MAG: hypothetical protein EZS28_050518 [Streblomastix strix]|uniref:Uncharacterized protein n=1 Tax=Streblomastix strix TaxID=222440 RepID=A0A5J4T984_9EUKA|nr:MAG: hypothetical protein EZS28_050518 [Streblomastix strix]
MSTITGSSFVKSDADNTVVLLGAGGTKPIAEFGGSVDDSNYLKNTGQLSQSFTRKLVRTDSTESSDKLETGQYATKYDIDIAFIKKGKNLQLIQRYLRNDGNYAEEVSKNDDFYMTRSDTIRNFDGMYCNQSIIGTKRFYDNVTAD